MFIGFVPFKFSGAYFYESNPATVIRVNVRVNFKDETGKIFFIRLNFAFFCLAGTRIRCNFNDVSSVVRRSVWEVLPLERGEFGEDLKFARAAIEAGARPDRPVIARQEAIFLDELGELPIELQPKLLRALDQREIRYVGE